MDRWNALRKWIEARRYMVFDLVRMYLGVGLFVKGIQFLGDRELDDYLKRHGVRRGAQIVASWKGSWSVGPRKPVGCG